MDQAKKNKDKRTGKEDDDKFGKKKIKHDPQAESARTKFGKEKES